MLFKCPVPESFILTQQDSRIWNENIGKSHHQKRESCEICPTFCALESFGINLKGFLQFLDLLCLSFNLVSEILCDWK